MTPALALALWLSAAAAAPTDDDCLACHSDPDARSEAGRPISVRPDAFKGSVHGGNGCTSCHSDVTEVPHALPLARPDCSSCHGDAVEALAKSVHGFRNGTLDTPRCSSCHGDAVEALAKSVHGFRNGTLDTPRCSSCHGAVHEIRGASDPASTVAKRNQAQTCGACHANPEFLARHAIPFARPVEAYKRSVHGRAVESGDAKAPSCASCHDSHAIRPAREAESRINHWRVPETCGSCHQAIATTYAASIHGQAAKRGVAGAPVCTDCHGEHAILAPSEPGSLVNPARVSSVTCGRCHGDERLVERYNLPKDKVPAYQDSFHGLALRAGSQTVANCASCHGVHNILPASDPRSTVHPTQVAQTCGSCHPGAGQRFAMGPVHVRAATASEHWIVGLIRVAYWILIPLTIGGMLLHNLLDFLAKLVRGRAMAHGNEQTERMGLHFRVAHALVVISFPILVLTGFALKFPEAWWARPLLAWESELAFRGWVHRAAGAILLLACVYHGAHLLLVPADRVILRQLWPRLKDLGDAWGVVLHNLGRAVARPLFGRFSYAEKAEYWAFAWGTVVMAVSGGLLWFNNFTLAYFPTWVSDAATALHYYEAILATLAILVWHLYMVIFDPDVYPMDKAWLTGKASAEHLRATRSFYREPAPPAEPAEPAEPTSVEAPLKDAPPKDAPPEDED